MNQNILKAVQATRVAEKMMSRNDYAAARDHLIKAQELFPGIEKINSMLTVCDILSKQVAEKMMIRQDYAGARENLLKVQELFPGIEKINSMLTVCDILSSVSVQVGGGTDYYRILQLTPVSTLDDIRCQHQKLYSILQSIRSTFPGTELALKHIEDALVTLSGKKTPEFDSKRSEGLEDCSAFKVQESLHPSTSDKKTVTSAQNPSKHGGNSYGNISNGNKRTDEMSSKAIENPLRKRLNFGDDDNRNNKAVIKEPTKSSADNLNSIGRTTLIADLDVSSDRTDLCKASQLTFMEGNASLPKDLVKKRPNQDFYNFENDRKPDHLKAGQIWATYYKANLQHNYCYAQIDMKSKLSISVTWLKPIPVTPSERRWCDAGLPVACGPFELNLEMKDEIRWPMVSFYKCSWIQGITQERFDIYPKRGEIWALYKDWRGLDDWISNLDAAKGRRLLVVEIISEFSKYSGANVACMAKVNGFNTLTPRRSVGAVVFKLPNDFYGFSHHIPAYRFRGGEIENVVPGMFELDQMALPDDMIQDIANQRAPIKTQSISAITKPENRLLMPALPQQQFETGQVWAIYCGKDCMPRRYVRIDDRISESQVRVMLLEPSMGLEHEIRWEKQNLPITCGVFEVSGTSVNVQVSLFSYLVQYQQSPCGNFYRICPLKGEIWAMYKNWDIRWKQHDHESYQTQIVEVVSDYSERDGVSIARLGEVKGCLTFFQRLQYDGFDLTQVVCREDMLSFSHRIPAFRVPGIGEYGIPENSWHLEPDALPPK
ncbi:hypothetical protein SLA2020_117380 [Shorea laevis]